MTRLDPTPWKNADPRYGYNAKLRGVSLEEARTKVVSALAEQGFGVLSEIDVRATLKKKIDVEVPPYVILGACNPVLASRALAADPGIGLLLPCNVCLWEAGDAIAVSIARPDYLFAVVANADLLPIAEEAGERLQRALARVTS